MDRDENIRGINGIFDYLGIVDFPEKAISKSMLLGFDKFRVSGELPFFQYGERQILTYQIFIKKYDRQNVYEPYVYFAGIDQPDRMRGFRIAANIGFTLGDAFNLLNGRAIHKAVIDFSSLRLRNQWFQLDFNSRDVHGNFKMETLALPDGAYRLGPLLRKLSVKEMNNPEERVKLILSLYHGNAEYVTLLSDGKEKQAYVEASPKNNSLNIYMPGGEKTSNSMDQQDKITSAKETPDHEVRKEKRKGKHL